MVYSTDFRKDVIDFLQSGASAREAREEFGVALGTVGRWLRLYEETGGLADRPPRGFFKKIDPEKLREFVRTHPGAYIREIAEAFKCSDTAIKKAFKRLGVVREKGKGARGKL
jgi:transposase